jgi:uncharacterized protein YjbI with pentapeptide repeats
MADHEQLDLLRQGVNAWRRWQKTHPLVRADLHGASLVGMHLDDVLLSHGELVNADLSGASLRNAWLVETNLRGADLSHADMSNADLYGALLDSSANSITNASGAILANATLSRADLSGTNLSDANLCGANLSGANLSGADLSRANLNNADLSGAILVGTDLGGADLTGCRIYGISVWDVQLTDARQQNLILTLPDQPEITVDNLEVGQFIYLLLHNEKIRDVIETVTSKMVLILGRFTDERISVLNGLREALRERNYLPVLFDFEGPDTRDITETVSLLARMARFIIADLTDPSSVPKELEAIVPGLAVPVQPLIERSARPYAMFKDYWKYDWVLPPYHYADRIHLLSELQAAVIAPAEAKLNSLIERRRLSATD